jgi:signal transduction histidine kinase
MRLWDNRVYNVGKPAAVEGLSNGLMKRSADSSQWVFFLTVAFLFGTVLLRSLLLYQDSPVLGQVLGLLATWLALFTSEAAISRRWPRVFPIYLVLQTIVVSVLLWTLDFPEYDYFAILFAVLSMQVMQRVTLRSGVIWLGSCTLLMAPPLVTRDGPFDGIALTLVYTAVNVFLGSYALATQRAQAARARTEVLAREVQETNRQLQAYSTQLEQLAVARERHRLARELHDSATQTIFSMNLTTQSALLLLDRDPNQVGAQLDRLNDLAHSALSEMRMLISELRPEKVAEGGLASALRRHLADRHLPEGLVVSLEVEGDQPLEPAEEEGLFRIAQEALNNVVKHAQASQAYVRLHLVEPFWMEIEDQGRGFDLQQTLDSAKVGGQVGLVSMDERATEIGWSLQMITSPDTGTCIRVRRPSGGK